MSRRIALRMLGAGLIWIGCNCVDAKSPLSLDILRRDGYGSVQLLEPSKNILLVPAEINGEKMKLLLDTGFAAKGITVGVNPQSLHIVPEKGGTGMMSASGKMTGIGHGIAQSVVMGNVHINSAPVFLDVSSLADLLDVASSGRIARLLT